MNEKWTSYQKTMLVVGIVMPILSAFVSQLTFGGFAWLVPIGTFILGVMIGFVTKEIYDNRAGTKVERKLKKRIDKLTDTEKEALSILIDIDVQAMGFVNQMYVDTFADIDHLILNQIDAYGHIGKIAHKSSDQPEKTNESGRKLHRYRLNEETKRVIDKFPEIFNDWRQFNEMLRALPKEKPYED